MQCPNCGKEAININGREICLDCGIEIAHSAPANAFQMASKPEEEINEQPVAPAEVTPPINVSNEVLPDTAEPEIPVSEQKAQEIEINQEIPEANVPISNNEIPEIPQIPEMPEAPLGNIDEEAVGKPLETQNEIPTVQPTPDINNIEAMPTQGMDLNPAFGDEALVQEEQQAEKIPVTVALEEENIPKVDLSKPQSENLESVEAKPISKLLSESPLYQENDNENIKQDMPSFENPPEPPIINQTLEASKLQSAYSPSPQTVDSIFSGAPASTNVGTINNPPLASQSSGVVSSDILPAQGIGSKNVKNIIFIAVFGVILVILILVVLYIFNTRSEALTDDVKEDVPVEVIE